MDTFGYIVKKYNLVIPEKGMTCSIIIPGMRRVDLAKLFAELKFKVGVEIGVWEGKYSEILCQNNPQLKLYAIDPWKVYGEYTDFTRQRMISHWYRFAINLLSKYNVEIIRKTSMEAVNDFADESLDFVYIDGNHTLKYITEDLVSWTKKVKKGGIVAGHDFITSLGWQIKYNSHVAFALEAFTKAYRIDYLFVLGKRLSKNRDYARSWFFIKE